MDTKPRTRLQRFAERLGIVECRLSPIPSEYCSEIRESKLLKLLTFGYVVGLSIDVWANDDEMWHLRIKFEVRNKKR